MLYRQPSDSGYPSVPDLRVGLIGTDVAFLPLGRHTLLLFTLHRKEIIQPVGVPENHIAGLNGQRSLKEKHKGSKELSKTRQDMRVYRPNPPISEVEGGSFISLDWLSVIHLVRRKKEVSHQFLGCPLQRDTKVDARSVQQNSHSSLPQTCHSRKLDSSLSGTTVPPSFRGVHLRKLQTSNFQIIPHRGCTSVRWLSSVK